jgi:hypothetical protein
MTIVNDNVRERPTGGPVPPWLAGQLIDVCESVHDPLRDGLLPSHIDIESWLDRRLAQDQVVVAIAKEAVSRWKAGRKAIGTRPSQAQQDLPETLGELENALKSDTLLAATKGARAKDPVEPGAPGRQQLKGDEFAAIVTSAEWFNRVRLGLLEASIAPVDLRTSWFSLVGNQGSTASCVGHAVADLIQRQRRMILDPPSARYIWQAAKELDGDSRPTTMIASAGTSLRAALSVVAEFGYATESEVPSRSNALYYGDLGDFYAGLARRKAARLVNLGSDTKCWLAWLQSGRPVVGSMAVGDRFLATRPNHDGSLPLIGADPKGTDRFSHAVLLLGYQITQRRDAPSSDSNPDREDGIGSAHTMGDILRATLGKQLPIEYLVRNSAGEGWGANGYAWMTQATLAAQAQEAFGLLWQDDLDQPLTKSG